MKAIWMAVSAAAAGRCFGKVALGMTDNFSPLTYIAIGSVGVAVALTYSIAIGKDL